MKWNNPFLPLIIVVCGCFDSPHYQTPLPNGYVHGSNGLNFGHFYLPRKPGDSGGSVIGPGGDGRWVNRFGWAGDFVIGEVSEDGRAPSDPEELKGYLLLDTKSGQLTEFDTLEELKKVW